MSFFVFLIYLTLLFIRPQEWAPAFLDKPLIDIAAIGTAVSLLIERLGFQRGGLVKVPQNGLMIALLVLIAASHAAHTYLGGLLTAIGNFSITVILFFLLLNTVNSETKFKLSIWAIIFLVLALVFQGMYQMDHGYGWAGQSITSNRARTVLRINWIGIFHDPNDLALTFVMAFGLALPFVFGTVKFMQRLVVIPFLGLFIYGIFLTNSRGGMIALVVTVFFYFVKRSKKVILGGIVGAILGVGLFALGPSRTALLTINETSAYNRVELWYQGILMMKSNPLFGVGFRMFQDSLAQTAHNSFILAGAELGLLGLFAWVGLIYTSFKGLSIIQVHDEKLKNYAYAVQASLVGFCVAAFFLSRTYSILIYTLFALSGSLMHIARERNPELKFTFSKRDARNTLLISLGSIGLAYIIIKIGL